MKEVLNIAGLSINQGEKIQTNVKILDTEFFMPVTIINGKKDGKIVMITSGIHGCEYPAIKTAIELAKEINPEDVSGAVIFVHAVNVEGFKQRRAYVMPEDNKNILRVFHGDMNGTISDKIAYMITHEFVDKADYYFDLHGGDVHENLLPHIYYPASCEKDISEESKRIAQLFNLRYYIKSNTKNGTYTSAAIRGVPSLLIERGGMGLCREEDVIEYKKDMMNVLSSLNVINHEKTARDFEPCEMMEAEYIDAENDGCWICFVSAGDNIKKGQKLGEVTDFFGNVIDTYYAKYDGVVLYNTVSLSAVKDSSLIAYGKR